MPHVFIDIRVKPEALRRLEAMPGMRVTCVEPAREARELPTETIRDAEVVP